MKAEVEKWKSQFKRGFLELCVLKILQRGSKYGLDILKILNEYGLEVKEGTLYPLLTRLGQEGILSTAWVTFESGHPRKFYELTALGCEMLLEMEAEYERLYRAFGRIEEGREK